MVADGASDNQGKANCLTMLNQLRTAGVADSRAINTRWTLLNSKAQGEDDVFYDAKNSAT
jgi:hypothetical protein